MQDQNIEKIIENLEENTTIRITAKSKRDAAINAMTIQIAKEEGDPMYERYLSGKKRWRKFRELIRQKYYSKAKMRVDSMR